MAMSTSLRTTSSTVVTSSAEPVIHAHLAHRSLKRLVAEGFYPVIIGKRDHVEVRGVRRDDVVEALDLLEPKTEKKASKRNSLERDRFVK